MNDEMESAHQRAAHLERLIAILRSDCPAHIKGEALVELQKNVPLPAAALPILEELLHDELLATAAMRTLQIAGSEGFNTVFKAVLSGRLELNETIIQAIGEFYLDARPALPFLMAKFRDEDQKHKVDLADAVVEIALSIRGPIWRDELKSAEVNALLNEVQEIPADVAEAISRVTTMVFRKT